MTTTETPVGVSALDHSGCDWITVEYVLLLRPNARAVVHLPSDLTSAEVERLYRWLKTLPVEEARPAKVARGVGNGPAEAASEPGVLEPAVAPEPAPEPATPRPAVKTVKIERPARKHSEKYSPDRTRPKTERDAAILAAIAAGMSREKVARDLKVGPKIVANVVFRAKGRAAKGIATKAPAPPPTKLTKPTAPPVAIPSRKPLPQPPVRRVCRTCKTLFDATAIAGHPVFDCAKCRAEASATVLDHDGSLDDQPLAMGHRH